MKILILGSNGMLGQMVFNYFSSRHKVYVLNKRYDLLNRNEFIDEVQKYNNCIIINCIGKIKQKTSNPIELYITNTLLPFDLANSLGERTILVQPSTDCVYSGTTTKYYSSDQRPNAVDDYGWSKTLGEEALLEKKNCYIVRVSIIGPDKSSTPKGLLGWFLSNSSESEIKGFTDHWWNGITTLEWCKKVESLIFNDSERIYTGKIIQLGTKEKYTKYELLLIFKEIYNTNQKIIPYSSGKYTNRCLSPNFPSNDIKSQLTELKLKYNGK